MLLEKTRKQGCEKNCTYSKVFRETKGLLRKAEGSGVIYVQKENDIAKIG